MELKDIKLIANKNKMTVKNNVSKTMELKTFKIDVERNIIFISAENKRGVFKTNLRNYDIKEIKETDKNIIIKTNNEIIRIEK